MTDQTPPEQQFAIQKIYLKDVSFESPNSPNIFEQDWKPEINVQISTENNNVGADMWEVVLHMTVTAKQEEKTVYLAEVKQAGLFFISGFDNDNLGGMMGAYCPEVLFAFAREELASLATKGGFPQLLLAPVNFNLLYAQNLQQRQAEAAGQGAAAH